jgi:hypothetical protein
VLSAAQAYVLQGPHIVELMIEEIGQADSLKIDQKVIFYNPETGAPTAEITETVAYGFPDRFRSEIRSAEIERIHVVQGGQAITVTDRVITADYESTYDYYKDLFLYNTRPLLTERLFDLGVEVTYSSLGRYKGRIAYVVGAQYPDESVPQVWFDKQNFRPFRWIISSRYGQITLDTVEFQYLGWRQYDGFWYPSRIEFYQNDRLTRLILVQRVQVNAALAPGQFNVRNLRSQYPEGGPLLPERYEGGDSDEVRQTLENFNKILEP